MMTLGGVLVTDEPKQKTVYVSSEGRRSGESHPKATLTDEDVELMRQLYEEHGIGYRKLADKFDCHPSTARDIVYYKRRAATVVGSYQVDLCDDCGGEMEKTSSKELVYGVLLYVPYDFCKGCGRNTYRENYDLACERRGQKRKQQ